MARFGGTLTEKRPSEFAETLLAVIAATEADRQARSRRSHTITVSKTVGRSGQIGPSRPNHGNRAHGNPLRRESRLVAAGFKRGTLNWLGNRSPFVIL